MGRVKSLQLGEGGVEESAPSTGRIGACAFPADCEKQGIKGAAGSLKKGEAGFASAARARCQQQDLRRWLPVATRKTSSMGGGGERGKGKGERKGNGSISYSHKVRTARSRSPKPGKRRGSPPSSRTRSRSRVSPQKQTSKHAFSLFLEYPRVLHDPRACMREVKGGKEGSGWCD